MKAMILAAGRGERLRPLTDTTPKPLLKAGKYRLIEYTIQNLVNAGITDIVINYAHLGEQFPSVLGDGSQFGANITFSPESQGGLETAGGIINALPLLGNEPFLVVNGDIWTDYHYKELVDLNLDENKLCHLVLVMNPEHNPDGDFGLRSRLLSDATERRYTYSGIGIYHPKLFTGETVSKKPLKPFIVQAMKNKAASGEFYYGNWSDIGTEERLDQLSTMLIQKLD
jgi:MurNAc alpha-1-phosphate uridylyltransferase